MYTDEVEGGDIPMAWGPSLRDSGSNMTTRLIQGPTRRTQGVEKNSTQMFNGLGLSQCIFKAH